MYITLTLAKQHLNLEQDFHDDDQYIMGLIGVCEEAVRVSVNEDFDVIAQKNGGCLPSPIIQAMLLLLGSMYQNREIAVIKTREYPFGYEYLISLYRNYCN